MLDPKSKQGKFKVANLKNFQNFNFLIMLDKMCKYEMDPASIVKDTEQIWFCPQTDRRMDGQTDKVKPVYPPFNCIEAGGIIKCIPWWLNILFVGDMVMLGPRVAKCKFSAISYNLKSHNLSFIILLNILYFII